MNWMRPMGILPELRAVRQAIYLEMLAETGSVTRATQAAGVHISLPAHWRRRFPAFAKAERQARQHAALVLLQRYMTGWQPSPTTPPEEP